MSVNAAEIPDVPILQTIGDRRSIRYYDPDKKVEDWKIQTILQAARFASCQGNINATEAIVVQKETCDIWDEIEECVSGFNVQMINQASHLIFWLTNLNAWYGRANDGLSTLALSGALLRYETGQAVGQAMLASTSLGLGNCLLAFGRKPGGVEKAFGLTPNLKFTWGHAVGYPLEDSKAGGQRPRLKFSKLFHKDTYGNPYQEDTGVTEALKQKGMIQEQAPLPGRVEEIDQLAQRFSREAGVVSWPEKEVRRLINDEDWDFGPRIKERAEQVIAQGGLPDYPEEMRETFQKLMEEHGLDTSKYLS
jgi:nitroreductase